MDDFYAELNSQGAKALEEINQAKLRQEEKELKNNLHKFLEEHDWYFAYSDDYKAWERGNANAKAIHDEMIKLENRGLKDEAIKIYNRYAPPASLDLHSPSQK